MSELLSKQPTKGLIMDVENPSSILYFQFNPIEIDDSYSARYNDHNIPGLIFPRSQWSNGTNRMIKFELHFFYSERNRQEILRKCSFLRSFLEPDYEAVSKLVKAPKYLLFGFGKLYKGIMEMRKCDIKYHELFDPVTLYPMKAICSIELKEIALKIPEFTVQKSSIKQYDSSGRGISGSNFVPPPPTTQGGETLNALNSSQVAQSYIAKAKNALNVNHVINRYADVATAANSKLSQYIPFNLFG